MQEAGCTSLDNFKHHTSVGFDYHFSQIPGGAAGRPAKTAGSGAGMPASTTGSRTGAGAEAGGSAGLGATGAVAAGAVGRPEMTGLVGSGAAGNPAARAGLATPGKAEDKLRMGEHETICLLMHNCKNTHERNLCSTNTDLSMEGRSGTGGVLAMRPTGVSCSKMNHTQLTQLTPRGSSCQNLTQNFCQNSE